MTFPGTLALTAPPAIGDPHAAAAVASHLAKMAGGLDAAALGIGRSGVTWTGTAAAAFAALVATQPREFARAAEACRTVSAALNHHADALGEAQAVMQRAKAYQGSDPTLAQTLASAAQATAESSGSRTAHTVRDVAESAPDKPNALVRLLRKGSEWVSELRLGAVEATEGALGFALSVNQFRLIHNFGDTSRDATRTATAVAESARDPVGLIKDVVDWDTWRSNPVRAAGHLAPDVVAALATGGAAGTARAAAHTARKNDAIDTARRLDLARRAAMEQAGTAARNDLLQEAITRGSVTRPRARDWTGEGGTHLSARDSDILDHYWSMSATREVQITQIMWEVSAEVRGILLGIENSLKDPDSFKRKIATQQAQTGASVERLLAPNNDTVRYTLVFRDPHYANGVVHSAAALERWGFHRVDVTNHWREPKRYRGVNTTWLHARSGMLIEVQFHTIQTNLATTLTHRMYERMRLPDTPPDVRSDLSDRIASAYARTPHPDGAEALTRDILPPPSPPKPVDPPPNQAPAVGAVGAAAATGTVTLDRTTREAVPQAVSGAR